MMVFPEHTQKNRYGTAASVIAVGIGASIAAKSGSARAISGWYYRALKCAPAGRWPMPA